MNEKVLTIIFSAGNYEWRANCRSLDDVASAIDDFSTRFCEEEQMTIYFYGTKKRMPVNIWCEENIR